MKLNEILSFTAVAEAQSVQEAANRLHLTQSAVSRLIQRLEADLGTTLFDRQTKPLTLTRDGQMALDHCRRVLKAVGDFTDAFTETAAPQGILRLGTSHVLARLLAAAPLDALRRQFSSLTLRLQTEWSSAIIEQVRAGSLDGGLVLLPVRTAPPDDLHSSRLALEEVHAAATPELLGRHGRSLAGMNAAGWVLQPDGCGYRTALARALDRQGLSMNVLVEAYDQDLLMSLAERGVGYTLAPTRLFRDNGRRTHLVPVTVEGFTLTVGVWLLRTRQSRRLDPVFDALEDELAQEFMPYHSAAE